MTPSRRNRLLVGVGCAVALAIVALLLAPSFVDLDGRKPQIIAEVKKATGRDLAIDGPISLSLLPVPSIDVSGVRFFNMPGAKNPNMVEVKSITVRPSLLALLVGKVEVNSVTLVQPKIVLEINAEGKPNWEFTPSVSEAKPAAARPSSPKPLSLGELDIEDGTLIFSDSRSGISIVAEKANLSASVGSVDGPYGLKGSATINGAPLTFDLGVGAKGRNGHSARAALSAAGGKLAFDGTLSELGPDARVVGKAQISAESLTAFATTLLGLAGQPAPALPPLLAGKFSFDGDIDLSQTAFAARDFKLTLNQDTGSGSLAVTLKPALAVDGKLNIPKVDLDAALAALSQPAAPSANARNGASPAAGPPAAEKAGKSWLADVTAKITIDIGELDYHKQPVRDVALQLDARGGAVALPKLSAHLPGDAVLQAQSTLSGDPARPTAAGDFSLVAPKLRQTLQWLGVDLSHLPPDKLTQLSFKGRLTSTKGAVEVPDATIDFPNLKAKGGLLVNFSVPLSVTARLDIDTFDLDSFLASPVAGQKTHAGPAAAPQSAPPPKAAAAGPVFGLKSRIAKLIYKKQTLSGVEADVAMQGDRLELKDIKVGNFATSRFAVRGSVEGYGTAAPRPDIAFNFEAEDMTKVLQAVGATAPAGLGLVRASGGVAGSLDHLNLKDLTVSAMGETAKASGVLSMPGAAEGSPRSVSYKGSLALNGQTIEGSVDAKLTGRPIVTADLRTTLLDLDKLNTPAGVKAAPAAAARNQTPAAARKIDTSTLRAFDGSLKLTAASLVSSPLHLTNATVDATLKEGVLTLSQFKGSLFGGTLTLSGAVNANQADIAYDLKGDASDIYIGEMLRSTSGTNMFGGTVKVTVDGKLSASSIALKGSGSTPEQLKSSMTGGAQLGGYIYAGADKALTTLGTAATGVVGGVIDNTLGSALGIVGQKGGVGVSNMLNAVSLVLNRFVNRNNPVSGRVDIAGGILTDKGLMVQGDRATANVSTRTELAKSTTNTTVNFMIAEDMSAPYLIVTARGPLSSPSLGVSRGTAKDPPGFVNTLEQGAGAVTNPVKSILPNVPVPNIPIPNLFGR
jgi:uncharacterized protein involved in outer membrane biogenesis